MKPYGIISDTHNHNWNQFSFVDSKTGVNNRLQLILGEVWRCASKVAEMGGDTIYHAGDLFHVRGSVAPSVMNPTRHCYNSIAESLGIKFVLIPGNHDMEHKQSNRIGNAIEIMSSNGIEVISNSHYAKGVLTVPWIENVENFKSELKDFLGAIDGGPGGIDLIIHAPIDGVLAGIPPHGITPGYLGSLGFKRVFAGHYHHHKDFGNGVYSIGAICHHTFGDVGAKAGFLIVTEDSVRHFEAKAPRFINLDPTPSDTEASIAEAVKGNYVKFKTNKGKVSEINEIRKFLEKAGAAGVIIDALREPMTVRTTTSTITSGASLETAVSEFVKETVKANAERVERDAQKILSEVIV